MRKQIGNLLLIILLVLTIMLPLGNTVNASNINLNVNGEPFIYETLIYEGRTYIPVRKFSQLLGSDVHWDADTSKVTIIKGNTKIKLSVNETLAIYNDKPYHMDSPLINRNGYTYAPVRFIAEALQFNVIWDDSTRTVNIKEKLNYIVKEGDTLASISGMLGISIDKLQEWNNLSTDQLYPGMKLLTEPAKLTAIDEVKTNAILSYSEEELDWLARIIFAEAQDEPYEGLVAVAAVVLNRVESPNFPSNIYDVIFQKNQFTPARTGKIYEITPDEKSYMAAKDALMGMDPVEGALYFYNPRISNSTFFLKKEFIKSVGNHNFYR